MNRYMEEVYQALKNSYGHESEFLQAVKGMFQAIEPVVDQHPEYEKQAILERLTSPERIIQFRVPWLDDQGQVHVNTGWRVQFSSLNGPYKGGLRFHPSVDQSVLKFLGFEQIFKNILTGLPIGGGKGGSDFNPKGKTDREIMAFCQSFMTELSKHIGPNLDVPAGDIGVGGRELGYLYGQYKRLKQMEAGVLTGKPLGSGGSLGRIEATGYGLVYFLNHMLQVQGDELKGKTVIISGSGNVAYYAAVKLQALGALVVAMSDSQTALYDPQGLDLNLIKSLKVDNRQRLKEYIKTYPETKTFPGSVWDMTIKADIALPCATQNEINSAQLTRLYQAGVTYLAEGANMPLTEGALEKIRELDLTYGPGKAANAGGVAVSAMEMSQNASFEAWSQKRVDQELQKVMGNIFQEVKEAAQNYGFPKDYLRGADIASFEKLVQLMLDQGLV